MRVCFSLAISLPLAESYSPSREDLFTCENSSLTVKRKEGQRASGQNPPITAPPVMNPAARERNADCSNFPNRFNFILFPESPFADNCLSGGREKGFQAKHLSMKDVIKMSYLNTGARQIRAAAYKHSPSLSFV